MIEQKQRQKEIALVVKKDTPTEQSKTVKKADSTGAKPGVVSKTPAQIAEEKKQQKLKDREARKKELEKRKQKIIADRKKAKEEREAKAKKMTLFPTITKTIIINRNKFKNETFKNTFISNSTFCWNNNYCISSK
jgi:microsomal dipeptidase-like Zn-dependent dipeptidase